MALGELNISSSSGPKRGPDWRSRDEEGGDERMVQEMMCYLVHHMYEEFVSSDKKKMILQKNLTVELKNYMLSVMQC
ncbi:unnamed protein product, partial [Allacma fusca]